MLGLIALVLAAVAVVQAVMLHTQGWRVQLGNVDQPLNATLIAGLFGLGGALGGVLLSALTAKWSHARTVAAEDDRRWLIDRRTVYAAYLTLTEQMLREIDGIGVFLRYDDDKPPTSSQDNDTIQSDLSAYIAKWDDELQPRLGEVQLLASQEVADLADRVASALIEITSPIELRRTFGEYFPDWFRARDLVVILRNAMRVELGLEPAAVDASPARRDPDWPWLTERRPPEEHEYGSAAHR
ncbi:hypothetical protein A5778_25420 [Mycolicibacterium monacense]|nr:hypothetical protein A5778_25420 [Mycolicibacterium monacense]